MTLPLPLPADLADELRQLRALLAEAAQATLPDTPTDKSSPSSDARPLDALSAHFRLNAFERKLLALCTGLELDDTLHSLVSALCGTRQVDGVPTQLALRILPSPDWQSLSPSGTLRRWGLLQMSEPHTGLQTRSLRVSERVLFFLSGSPHQATALEGTFDPVRCRAASLAPGHERIAREMIAAWTRRKAKSEIPLLQLEGQDADVCEGIGLQVAQSIGMHLYRLDAHDLPDSAEGSIELVRRWELEAFLCDAVLMLHLPEAGDAVWPRARLFAEHVGCLCITSGPAILQLRTRPHLSWRVSIPSAREQESMWNTALGTEAAKLNGAVRTLASQFRLTPEAIHEAARRIGSTPSSSSAAQLWAEAKRASRRDMAGLAEPIRPYAQWEDLVLPEAQLETLRTIAAQARHLARVAGDWGFAEKSPRGLGIHALFSGPSGTGKTMAAEVLANELDLDLYRIDLSAVVSKYIGETEKNLKRIFDAADHSGCMLFFDEADALFGKRTEVRDSHDRYANIEVSYLLQRIENYRGVAILTTNLRQSMDHAFTRRLRYIVNFPFPDQASRTEIWKRVFPESTPLDDLDYNRLGRLSLTGGHIRNVALNAAFLAAEDDIPLNMQHLKRAALSEFAKLEQTPNSADLSSWK